VLYIIPNAKLLIALPRKINLALGTFCIIIEKEFYDRPKKSKISKQDINVN